MTYGIPKPPPRQRPTTCPKCGARKPWGKGCLRCPWRPEPSEFKRVSPISDKRRGQQEKYPAFRKRILERDGGCVACITGLPWCPGEGPLEVDHVHGRRGEHLLDEWNAVTLHRSGHVYKTEHATECRPQLDAYLESIRPRAEGA